MTRKTNARIAGVTLLLYIAVGVAQMLVGRSIVRSKGTAILLASMAEHSGAVRLNAMLGLGTSFVAFALGISLYGLTRAEDDELALLALVCRAAEGVIGALPAVASLGLLWLAGEHASAPQGATGIADMILTLKGSLPVVSALFFTIGSLIFSWLLLRARIVPVPLAVIGVIASALLSVLLPLQLIDYIGGTLLQLMWAPMAVFELGLAGWLLVRGAQPPALRPAHEGA